MLTIFLLSLIGVPSKVEPLPVGLRLALLLAGAGV